MAVKKGTFDSVFGQGKERKNKAQGSKITMSLNAILDRPHGDTRELNSQHVQELAESIAAVGLIQPLAIDHKGHLLAGGHRRAALTQLQDNHPDRYAKLFPSGVPVRRFEFDAATDPDQAIAIEAAENEKRRDYTPAEVRELADRLVEAGFSDSGGRPKKGQKALVPALMTIVGKSRATVKRYLHPSEKSSSSEPLSKFEKRAQQLDQWANDPDCEAIARRLKNMANALRELS